MLYSRIANEEGPAMIVWHPIGVNDQKPRYPSLPEIEGILYDAALLLAAWVYVRSLFWG